MIGAWLHSGIEETFLNSEYIQYVLNFLFLLGSGCWVGDSNKPQLF